MRISTKTFYLTYGVFSSERFLLGLFFFFQNLSIELLFSTIYLYSLWNHFLNVSFVFFGLLSSLIFFDSVISKLWTWTEVMLPVFSYFLCFYVEICISVKMDIFSAFICGSSLRPSFKGQYCSKRRKETSLTTVLVESGCSSPLYLLARVVVMDCFVLLQVAFLLLHTF
jgi:hypothetical protein